MKDIEKGVKNLGMLVETTRDPPDHPPWDQMKTTIFDKDTQLDPLSEAYMFLAARIDNYMGVILEALADGAVVLADRFSDSWIAYQAPRLARKFGGIDKAEEFLLGVHEKMLAIGVLRDPDLTVLIDDDPKRALKRVKKSQRTKFEREENLEEVRAVYLSLANRFPDRIRIVEAKTREQAAALEEAKNLIIDWIASFNDVES